MVLISSASLVPTDPSVLFVAVQWLQSMLLGTVSTTVAIIAVASVGFTMLTGRIHYRRGLTVVAGCFVLFGAPRIAAGFRSAADGVGLAAPPREPVSVAAEALPPQMPLPPSPPTNYDPYAGASVPMR